LHGTREGREVFADRWVDTSGRQARHTAGKGVGLIQPRRPPRRVSPVGDIYVLFRSKGNLRNFKTMIVFKYGTCRVQYS